MVQRLFRLPWAYLPSNKAAVAVIASVRVVDFYQIASFQTCITLHLQCLDPGLPLADVARNVGIAQGIFTAAQIVSAPAWGVAADRIGRKAVILIGLVGTAVACVAVAFAGSFQTIVLWRLFAGAVNGTVVAARAAMSDSLPPQHRPAGFSTLVLAFHVANAVGPLLTAASMRSGAGTTSSLGLPDYIGENRLMASLSKQPYALPNLLSALFLLMDALLVWFKLEETSKDAHQIRHMAAVQLQSWTARLRQYRRVPDCEDQTASTMDSSAKNEPILETEQPSSHNQELTEPLWTPRLFIVLATVAILEFHLGAFGSMWALFVVADRRKPDAPFKLPFTFTGGLQLESSQLGFAMGMLGIIGTLLQFTAVPYYTTKKGAVRSFKASLPLFAISLFLAPYLSLVPAARSGTLWLGIFLVLFLHVISRSFGILASILLVNQATNLPSRRGTVHGIGNTVSSTFRTAGAMAGGVLYGLGEQRNQVGFGWWFVCFVSIQGWIMGCWL
ncbi:putative membrane protein [Colletotrichum higginsianum]|uniref:Putative membrane protein n=1 Tax=Colletotrichum higginsianum TaxID=80884 RepID=A0A4V4NA71_9PEZI|nr:putative membrane protein [Colletotrichum higginsianum]